MKKIIPVLLIYGFLAFQTVAQNLSSNEFQKLEQRISITSTFKDIEKTISEAKKIAQNNEKIANGNQESIADNLIRFAIFRKKVFLFFDEKRKQSGLPGEELTEAYLKYHGNAKEIRDLLERAIKIYEIDLKKESLQLATAKYEFAWLADNYIPQAFGPVSWKERLERLNNSQNLYSRALILQSKFLDANDDAVLLTTFFLANSYTQSADFEKALPLYEKYISAIEIKYGKKSDALTPAMEMEAAILKMIGKEDSTESLLFLSPRAKTFKYEGINAKAGKVVLETIYKTPKLSNSPKISFSSISVQGGAIFPEIIPVIISVDENGKVIRAEAQIEDGKEKDKIEKSVREWEFKPFVYKEQPKKMKGVVYYYTTK